MGRGMRKKENSMRSIDSEVHSSKTEGGKAQKIYAGMLTTLQCSIEGEESRRTRKGRYQGKRRGEEAKNAERSPKG